VTLRSPTLQVAIALVAGFVAGIVLRGTEILRFIEPLGTVWINAIRMPVLPLIVMMLIASIAGSETRG
jgi:proton glutamate symport protein